MEEIVEKERKGEKERIAEKGRVVKKGRISSYDQVIPVAPVFKLLYDTGI
jgi:hypothetical protein